MTGIHFATSSEGRDTPSSEGGHPHTPTTCDVGHSNFHRRQINRNAPNQMTQPSQQPLPSHGRYQPAGGTNSTEHSLQGTWRQRTPTCILPTSTHSGQPWQNKTSQGSFQKNQLTSSSPQGGERRRTSFGGHGSKIWQNDELPPTTETSQIQESMVDVMG